MKPILFFIACVVTLSTVSGQVINDTLLYFKGEPSKTLAARDFKVVGGFKLNQQSAMQLQRSVGNALKISPKDAKGRVTLTPGNGYKMYYAAKGNRWVLAPGQQSGTLMSNAELNRISQLKAGLKNANYLALIIYPEWGKSNSVKCDVHPFAQPISN